MVHLELSEQEAGQLNRILGDDLSELRFEIMDTDNEEFRRRLQRQEAFLKDLLARLPASRKHVLA